MSKNVLAAVKILQNIFARCADQLRCLLPDIHEPASLQPNTVFPWFAWEWRHAARGRHNTTLIEGVVTVRRSPRNAETVGAKAIKIICLVYQLVDSQTSISLYLFFSGLIAGLQESSPKEPKMHLNSSWRPGDPNGELTALPRPPSWWGGSYCPIAKNSTLVQPFGHQASVLRASPRPRNVDFVPTPLTASPAHLLKHFCNCFRGGYICKIKHLQKCFRAVDFPRLCHGCKKWHVTTL